MNIKRALLLPWQVTQTGMRWLVLVLLGAAVIGSTAFAVFSSKPDMWVRVAGIIGLTEAFVWGLCLNNSVLLTIDAHQLRVPGITRNAVVGVALNGVLGAMLPAVVIGSLGGHVVVVGILIALMSVVGFLYSVLPRAAGMALYFVFVVPVIGNFSTSWATCPDFLAWVLPILILGLALIALCWRRLTVAANPYQMTWSTPSTLRMGRMESAAVAGRGIISTLRARPDWLQARPDLRGCGPGHPVASLRMALGGAGTPLTYMGWLRQSAGIVLTTVLLVVMLVWGLHVQHTHVLTAIESGGAMALLGIAAALCTMQAVTSTTHIMARWCLVSAELPLLALLPQLGNHVKRDVLRAALWPAMRLLLVAALLVLLVVTRVHQRAIDIFAVLVVVTAAAQVVAFSLRVVGGDRRRTWESGVAGILALVLFLLGVLAVVLSSNRGNPSSLPAVLWPALLAGWFFEIVLLWRLGRRGWRSLQQRPHPFLPN